MNTSFSVIKKTPSSSNPSTLLHISIARKGALGFTSVSRYVWVDNESAAAFNVGESYEADLSGYADRERSFPGEDGTTITCTYLEPR